MLRMLAVLIAFQQSQHLEGLTRGGTGSPGVVELAYAVT
jgi:hypothetical protein